MQWQHYDHCTTCRIDLQILAATCEILVDWQSIIVSVRVLTESRESLERVTARVTKRVTGRVTRKAESQADTTHNMALNAVTSVYPHTSCRTYQDRWFKVQGSRSHSTPEKAAEDERFETFVLCDVGSSYGSKRNTCFHVFS